MKSKLLVGSLFVLAIVVVIGGFLGQKNFFLDKPESQNQVVDNETTSYVNPLPAEIGQCSRTKVMQIETRLVDCKYGDIEAADCKDVPGSGSAILYANGGYQVSYEQIPAVDNSKVGDDINLCLVAVPKDCPPGDDRGKIYHATNLRTKESWELPDSEHFCGGA